MQPATAEIDGEAGRVGDRPGASAQALARLHDQAVDAGLPQPVSSGDAGRTAADNHDFAIAGHFKIPRLC